MKLKIRERESVQSVRDALTTTNVVKEVLSKGDFNREVVSTGSTLLDLAISGGRKRGGGIPMGIITEVFGPSGSGKTAILSEICASAQRKGGSIAFLDPEARLDEEYTKIYGVEMDKSNYHRPNTVSEFFAFVKDWDPSTSSPVSVIATDSLDALTTELQVEGKDKRGQKRAKDFSEGLRLVCLGIREKNMLLVCSNQIREGEFGETTSGGHGIPFYSSLRIRVGPPAMDKYIIRKSKVRGKEYEKKIGIKSTCIIKKSTVDDPFREAPIYIVFNYGIDDIRANLQFCKDVLKEPSYDVMGQSFRGMSQAISHVEKNNLQEELKEKTIALWEEIENSMRVQRPPKKRS